MRIFFNISNKISAFIPMCRYVISFPYRLLSNLLGHEKSGIYIFPHFRGRSLNFLFPYRIILLLLIFFFITLSVASFLSIQNLILSYFNYQSLSANQKKKTIVTDYQVLIKDYLITYAERRKQIENTVAVLFNSKNKNKNGVGGSRDSVKETDLLFDYNRYQSSPENWDNFFKHFSDQEYISFIDKNLINFGEIFSLIDKFEIFIDQQKRISKSIPSSWPVRSLSEEKKNSTVDLSDESKIELQTSLQKNSQGVSVEEDSKAIDSVLSLINEKHSSPKSLFIDIKQPTAVVATSRGIVNKVEKKNDIWSVTVQHEFGFSTYYEGLETVLVKEGNLVNRLNQIGTIGNGLSSQKATTKNPKLNYQIKIASKFVDPRDFLVFNY